MFTKPPCGLRPVSIFTSLTLSPSRSLSTFAILPSKRLAHPFRPLNHHAFFPLPSALLHPPHANRHASITTATRIIHNPRVNPPASTLPAPLVLPTRSSDQGTFSYYFSLGRGYLTFYKTGLKAVYSNYQASRQITAALPPGTTIPQAVAQGLLTRSDFQVLRRSRHDVARIPLFAVVFCVFGEFTPLVVVFLSEVVPRTCKIPAQVASAREKAEKRRSVSFRSGLATVPSSSPTLSKPASPAEELADLGPEEILHLGRSLGLFAALWERLGLGPPVGLVRRRAIRQLEYLHQDDLLIRKNGGADAMEIEEVRFALEERGLDVLGKNDVQLTGLLKSWLKESKKGPVTRLLLTRPSVWAKEM